MPKDYIEIKDGGHPLKILFIQPEYENIGIEYISAILKRHHHQVELVFIPKPCNNTAFKLGNDDENLENNQIRAAIEEFQPDIIGFSPITMHY